MIGRTSNLWNQLGQIYIHRSKPIPYPLLKGNKKECKTNTLFRKMVRIILKSHFKVSRNMENLAQSLFQLFTSLSNISKYKSMGFIIALGFISYRECFIKIPSTVLHFHLLQSIVRRWVTATPFLRHPLPFIQHASLYSFRSEHKFMFKHMTQS